MRKRIYKFRKRTNVRTDISNNVKLMQNEKVREQITIDDNTKRVSIICNQSTWFLNKSVIMKMNNLEM